MDLALPVSFAPMEAKTALKIPHGAGWQFEPKWDGFRCLVFRDGPELEIQSKAGQPLARYFPELVEALLALEPQRFVIDGELVVPIDGKLSFDALLQRIHPAASRIAKLAKETPAQLIVFDLLVDTEGRSCVDEPLPVRRDALEKFASTYLASSATIHLSPATGDLANAKLWLQKYAGGLDGIVAKRTDIPYASGSREGMLKIKNLRTADCVVGGFRYGSKGGQVGSLLLGLYDNAGLLHHVGFTSGLAAVDKP
ncbi:MAG TPA: ATP-dependent DNA ligase, partial [Bryobacteraceae bacterium]|nr:ATP-dependent DNA ligase [Bryobacteraceae bacterium]